MGWHGRSYRPGEWLVVDDESGHVVHSSDVVKRWDGIYVRKDQNEPPHPQWFVRAKDDPRPVPFVRPDEPSGRLCRSISEYIPGTTSKRPKGAAGHLYIADQGIGSMEIGCSFMVYP